MSGYGGGYGSAFGGYGGIGIGYGIGIKTNRSVLCALKGGVCVTVTTTCVGECQPLGLIP